MNGDKKCSRCGIVKDFSEFSPYSKKTSRLRRECKACRIEKDRQYREANRERIRERQRLWHIANADRIRKKVRIWQEENPEKAQSTRRSWVSEHRDKMLKFNQAWRASNPEKYKAHRVVKYAIESGKLVRASEHFCFVCGCQATEYHHVDYDKPLDVFPVCICCHKRWHSTNNYDRMYSW